MIEDEEYVEDCCDRCGGGIDKDHPTTCSACLFERYTGLNYEASVDAAMKHNISLAEYVKRKRRVVITGDLY